MPNTWNCKDVNFLLKNKSNQASIWVGLSTGFVNELNKLWEPVLR